MKYVVVMITLVLCGCSPEEQVYFADGTHTQRSHWQDRWIIINYWAEWCGPCRHEIPELNELHHNRVSNGVVVLGVNYDGIAGDELNAVIERMSIDFPVVVEDPQPRYGFERAAQLPMTVLINPAREVHDILVGPQTAESLLAAIR